MLFITAVFIMPFISSCGKGGNASSVGFNTQLEILNLGPDVHPVNLFVQYIMQGTTSYFYPSSSGYFYLNSIGLPLQVRTAAVANTATVNLITIDTGFLANHKYSIYITGLVSNNTLSSILTLDDTTGTPAVGFGKIRFVNAAISSQNIATLDVAANGTAAFTKIPFKGISPYVLLPAGNYVFQIYPTGSPTTLLPTPTLQSTTIQDGRLYTLYSYGIVLNTDTSAFGASVIINR